MAALRPSPRVLTLFPLRPYNRSGIGRCAETPIDQGLPEWLFFIHRLPAFAPFERRRAARGTRRKSGRLPFWRTVSGRPHLIVPYSLTNNDGEYAGSVGTSDDWFAFVRDAFDMLYREGRTQPKMMSVGLHMRLIGHPARAVGLERLLDHIGRHSGVWVTRRLDIAQHWRTTFPAASQTSKTRGTPS